MEVLFWLIREDDPSDFEGISWASYLDQWLALVVRSGRFSVHGQVATLEDLTAKDYVESDPLDLDHLSRRDG